MRVFQTLKSKTVVLPASNIDTDQIIPARFLKVTDKQGLGDNAFADWRYADDGTPKPDFVLNRPEAQGCEILVAGHNFGCGSSREHAPWALLGYGFRAVISTGIADIFRNNALKNGLLPVVTAPDFHQKLLSSPGQAVYIDLEAQTVIGPDGISCGFQIDPFARYCLLHGMDHLDFLLKQEPRIREYEETLS